MRSWQHEEVVSVRFCACSVRLSQHWTKSQQRCPDRTVSCDVWEWPVQRSGRMELRMTTGRSGVSRLLLAAACCCAVQSAQAASGSPDEQVTVVQDTPYTVRQQVTERGNMSKMEVRQTSVSKGVSYSDLDLSKDSDVAILRDRAREAALDVCRQAERRAGSLINRPLDPSPNCVTTAKQQALGDVNRIVANARSTRTVAAN